MKNNNTCPSFSIIIPVYNRAELVKNAINAVLSQDYENYELIIVDDGSTDSSGAVCDEYANNYSNVTAIHRINGGLASARNTGMDAAKNDYILFCDDDDCFEPNALTGLAQIIREHDNPDMVVFGLKTDSGWPVVPTGFELNKSFDRQYIYIYIYILQSALNLQPNGGKELYPFACNKAYRRGAIEKNKHRFIEGLRTWEDKIFWTLLIGDLDSVVVTDKCFYYYKDGADNRLAATFNFQMLSMMPLKHRLTAQKYGDRFDLDTQYYADYKADSVVGLIVRFYKSKQADEVDKLWEILSDELLRYWLNKANYKDKYKERIAKCVLRDDYAALKTAVGKYEKKKLREQRRESIREKLCYPLRLIKRIARKLLTMIGRK